MYSCFNSIIHFKGSITICFSASIPSISFIIFSCKIRFTSFSFPFYSIEILFFKSKIFISFPLPCIFPFKYEPLNINFPYLVKSLACYFFLHLNIHLHLLIYHQNYILLQFLSHFLIYKLYYNCHHIPFHFIFFHLNTHLQILNHHIHYILFLYHFLIHLNIHLQILFYDYYILNLYYF